MELSIVLMIIGTLLVGVTQGTGMINSARLTNARSNTIQSPVAKMDGLVAWYETSLRDSLKSAEQVNAAKITEWRDISPSSIAAQKNKLTRSASIAVVYRLAAINKVPAIEFNGTAKISLASFYQGATAQATIFLVFKTNYNPSGTQVTLFDADTSQSTFSLGIKSTTVSLNAGTAVDTATGTNPASFTGGASYIVAAYFNGSSSHAYVNDATTKAGNGNINSGSNSLNGVTIGSNKSGGAGFTGMISEVIIFNRPLQLQERKDVMSYLSKKYKISVTGL